MFSVKLREKLEAQEGFCRIFDRISAEVKDKENLTYSITCDTACGFLKPSKCLEFPPADQCYQNIPLISESLIANKRNRNSVKYFGLDDTVNIFQNFCPEALPANLIFKNQPFIFCLTALNYELLDARLISNTFLANVSCAY
ncbi:hypothetical protein CHS0354_007013 [Potamilus streckersoni]|uniref:Uncharacterized protein n=1 Tax=Potamilus streckersoni TaxID=2493646 RepID=A0AAE0VKI9_9BIVA|nr:hypothetical protein CHS0354_007013 [Potamilus streckersoni]